MTYPVTRAQWLCGNSEMAERIRAFDWAATPLGPIGDWPQSLRTVVNLMLAARQPIYIAWGSDLASLYNDGYIPFLGSKHPDGLGKPYSELWAEIWNEFRPVVEVTMAGEAQYFVDRPVALAGRLDRPMSWFTFSWTPLRAEAGSVVGFYCAATETTERVLAESALKMTETALRENQKRLEFALQCSHTGGWESDLTTLTANRTIGHDRIFGYETLLPTWTYEMFLEHVLPEDRTEVDRRFREAVANATTWSVECRIRRVDGEVRWIWAAGERQPDESGTAPRMAGIVQDITDRKHVEQALRESLESLTAARIEAEQANVAKSRFLAAASHDLRQPLSALSLYVGALRRQVGPVGTKMLINMKDCIDSLSELLSKLLDLSKLDAGVVMPNPSDFRLGDELAQLASVHAPEAQTKGLRLRCLPTAWTVHTDPVLFRRLLGNLIENAIRYTEKGGVLVAARRRLNKTWIEVWDTGIGMPSNRTAEAFEEFRQLHDEARTRGSGLGLAIVGKTAALLGLQIRVHSRLGRGSMFAIEVPVAQPREFLLPVVARLSVPRRLSIALVEDNDAVRQALVAALEGAGHHVVSATSGSELRVKLGKEVPGILVSDYRLCHDETGLDVIAAARAIFGDDIPAILLTGDTDPSLVRNMADRGIVVLHKPVELEDLEACLEDLAFEKMT